MTFIVHQTVLKNPNWPDAGPIELMFDENLAWWIYDPKKGSIYPPRFALQRDCKKYIDELAKVGITNGTAYEAVSDNVCLEILARIIPW